MNRRTALVATGLACLITLVGCGSDSPSSSSPSSSPSASTSSSATLAGPPIPASAKGESRQAAEAFVGYWVETLNYATKSGDTEGLETLAAEDCASCADFAGTLDRIYGAGGHVETKGWKLESAVPVADQPEAEPSFQLALKLDAQKVYKSKDAKAQEYPGGSQPARIFLIREDDHWLVKRLDI